MSHCNGYPGYRDYVFVGRHFETKCDDLEDGQQYHSDYHQLYCQQADYIQKIMSFKS